MVENLYAGFLNMDHRTDRLNHMEGQFQKIGLKPVRHRGKKPQEYDLNDPKYRVMLNRTPGAIACHEGQIEIMKTAQSIGAHALVMEDDIIFCEDFEKRLGYIDNWTNDHEWDVIWLGASFHVNPPYWHKFGQSGMPPDCSAQL
jgi:GR25 family glycosyltransferase involved in LPS biosynthesis